MSTQVANLSHDYEDSFGNGCCQRLECGRDKNDPIHGGKPDESLHVRVDAAVSQIARIQSDINQGQVGAVSVIWLTKALNGLLMNLTPVRDEYERRHGGKPWL